METKVNEDLGFNQGLRDGVSLSALGAPGGQLCGEVINLMVAVVKFETPNKAL